MVKAKYIIKQPTELITKGSKRKTEVRNLVDFYAENHDKIMIPAMQREANAWNASGPSFLIDSILRGYDIPKFYIKVERINGKNTYFMIDGQQRWNSIDKFLRNELKLPSNAPPIILPGGKIVNIADRSYNDLKTGIGKKGNKGEDSGRELITKYFDEYDIDISFLRKEWDPKSQDDMFLRLQLGSPLKGVERRFGNTTNNIRNFLHSLSTNNETNHKFFGTESGDNNKKPGCLSFIGTTRKRHRAYNLAEKMLILEAYFNEGFSNDQTTKLISVGESNADKIYSYENLPLKKIEKRIRKTLDLMVSIIKFGRNWFKFKHVIPLYLVSRELVEYNSSSHSSRIREWYDNLFSDLNTFDNLKQEEEQLTDRYLVHKLAFEKLREGFLEKDTNSGRSLDKIRDVMLFSSLSVFNDVPDLKKITSKGFSESQKRAIWRLAQVTEKTNTPSCKLCGVKILKYDNYEPDHIIARKNSKLPGRDKLKNGQTVHGSQSKGCNQRKGNN